MGWKFGGQGRGGGNTGRNKNNEDPLTELYENLLLQKLPNTHMHYRHI